jgi:hypothetical protein
MSKAYRVVSIQAVTDNAFGGTAQAASLERILNNAAAEGYRVLVGLNDLLVLQHQETPASTPSNPGKVSEADVTEFLRSVLPAETMRKLMQAVAAGRESDALVRTAVEAVRPLLPPEMMSRLERELAEARPHGPSAVTEVLEGFMDRMKAEQGDVEAVETVGKGVPMEQSQVQSPLQQRLKEIAGEEEDDENDKAAQIDDFVETLEDKYVSSGLVNALEDYVQDKAPLEKAMSILQGGTFTGEEKGPFVGTMVSAVCAKLRIGPPLPVMLQVVPPKVLAMMIRDRLAAAPSLRSDMCDCLRAQQTLDAEFGNCPCARHVLIQELMPVLAEQQAAQV